MIRKFYFDGEEEVVEEVAPKITTTSPPSSTFTQEQVNSFLAEERRKAQKANEKTIKQLQELQKTAQLTVEEKERLETRIDDLRNESLTKEELAKREAKKETDKIKKEQEVVVKERDMWKERYITSTIDRELLDAAGADSFNPSQILDILRPKTRLVEELDESNQPTGRLVPKVRIAGKDKDGNSVTLDLTATEAVKQMKEIPELYGNLFRSGANSGLGGNNTPIVRKNSGPPLDDPVAYREWRKKNMAGVRKGR